MITPKDVSYLRNATSKLRNLRGDGIYNSPGSLTIAQRKTRKKIYIIGGGGGGSIAGTQLTYYEVAATPNMVSTDDYYKLRTGDETAWANGVNYVIGSVVKKTISAVEKRYQCILAHKSGGNQWVADTHYLVGDRVWHGTAANNTTYKCATENTDHTWTVGKWTADNDEPENGAWATYWSETYLHGYIFAAPFDAHIQDRAPILIEGEAVITIIDNVDTSKIWIIAPGFVNIGTGYSLKWNTTDRRLMSVFGG